MLTSIKHSSMFSEYRARFILSRVYVASAVFSILTPLWMIASFLLLPLTTSEYLAVTFVVCDISFILLAVFSRRSNGLTSARLSVTALFSIPTVFFVVIRVILSGHHFDSSGQALAVLYAFSPFVFVACIAIFPLVMLETIAVSVPVLLTFLASDFFHFSMSVHNRIIFTGMKDVSLSILLLFVAIVSGISSLSQLNIMHKLFEESIQDPLTHLWNRRSGEKFLQQQMAYAKRHHVPISVVFLDMDNFKRVNDTFGHKAGDHILTKAAEHLKKGLRISDAIIRWGGEEFVIVLPKTTYQSAYARIAALCQSDPIKRPDGQPLTWSGGIAQWPGDRVDSWEELVKSADERMYRAKHDGKNRIYTQ